MAEARVLIAGAGIGGLAGALALAGHGFTAQVLERSSLGEQTGAGIQLGPNATRLLRDLGAFDLIEPSAFRPEAVVIFDALTGAELRAMRLGKAVEERYGAPYLTIHRADLHEALLASCRDHDGIEFSDLFEVVEAEPAGAGIAARAADGREAHGSALVAADGLWSRLRYKVEPAATLRFAGATAWRALVPSELLGPRFQQPVVGLWLGPRAHLVHYPVRGGNNLNAVVVIEGGEAEPGWNRKADTVAPLAAATGKWTEAPQDLIRHAESWRCWSLYRMAPLSRWTHERVALLGDAAHPVLPYLAQGAALALEDAAALANCLAGHEGDAPRAFSAYEALRRPRARKVARLSARYGRIYHLSGPARTLRNLVLKRGAREQLPPRFDWLYGAKPGPMR